MTTIEKLREALLAAPRTFRFRDFVRVMESYGYEVDQKGATSGSRVRFWREADDRIFIMHAPHPSDEMSRGAIRAAVRFIAGEEDR